MWGFPKESGIDILDLPDLNRRKLIKLPEEKELESRRVTTDGFFDLSQSQNSVHPIETPTEENNSQASQGVTDFLSDFASIGASNPNITPTQNQSNNESESVSDLKWRIENLEFKLEQLTEKLNSLNL